MSKRIWMTVILGLASLLLIAGCIKARYVTPGPALSPTPDLSATMAALVTENARLVAQVATLKPPVSAATAPTLTPVPPTAIFTSIPVPPTPAPLPAQPDGVLDLVLADSIFNGCPKDEIAGSIGTIVFFSRAIGGLKGVVQLSGLKPDHIYALALNGWPGHPSNDVLGRINCGSPDDCGFYHGEGFWNFMRVSAGSDGRRDVTLNVPLPPLDYTVKFLVKDPTTPTWCIVLYSNSLKFSVQ